MSPQRNGESSFEFFNRAGGSLWRHSRKLHQDWADRLDDREYVDVRSALRSNDAQARSAFLELYVHESLIRSGHQVVVHPVVPRSTHRPDFFAQRAGSGVYVEAIAPGTSREAASRTARLNDLLAALDQVRDDNFYLMTRSIVPARHSAPTAGFRKSVREWLLTLDPDSVSTEDFPIRTFELDDWSVTVAAVPVRRERRGSIQRSIGVYAHSEAELIDDGATLVRALRSKSGRYGGLDAPFVIAVGTHTFDEEDEDVFNALYGSVSWLIPRMSPSGENVARPVRNRDGYFGSPGAWRNRRVSAVLVVNQLSLHDPTRARVSLWTHPDALFPLPDRAMFPGVIHEWDGETTSERDGLEARSFFGLADDWPQGERWSDD